MEMTISFQISLEADMDKKAIKFTGPVRVMAGPSYDCPICMATFIDTLKKISTGKEVLETEFIDSLKKEAELSKINSLPEMVERAVAEVEKKLIIQALEQAHWKREKAASLLKVSLKTLYNKMDRHAIYETCGMPRKGRHWIPIERKRPRHKRPIIKRPITNSGSQRPQNEDSFEVGPDGKKIYIHPDSRKPGEEDQGESAD